MQGGNVNIQNWHYEFTDPKTLCQPCEDIEFSSAFGALEVPRRQYRNKGNYSGASGLRTSGGQRSSPVVKRPTGRSSWTTTFCPAHPVTVPA